MRNADRTQRAQRNKAPLVDVFKIARLWVEDRADTLSSETSRQILGHIRARDWLWLMSVGSDTEPAKQGLQTYITLSQLRALFKKNDDFADEQVCLESARSNFFRAERICKITNKRIDYYSQHEDRLDDVLREQVGEVRRILRRTCGDVGEWRNGIPSMIRITSGATASSPRKRSLPYMKIRKTYRATPGAHPYIDALVRYHVGGSPRLITVGCNRVVTVPKDSLTYRTIAAEPEGNLPFQLTIDTYWKRRLARVGICLDDQSKNQRLALVGSIDGSVATIDLSMASDTVSLNAVLWLFPEEWSEVLMSLRTPAYKGIFGYGLYQKFSSMGNGFTFALETMLFYAIVKAVGSNVCSVYGDDIICDASSYDAVVRLLRFFGFIPNQKKSFSTGPFRESCGADWFSGSNVRPFFFRSTPRNKHELCHFVNGMLSVGNPGGKLWEYLRWLAREERLPLVPWNFSSYSGVHISPDVARQKRILRSSGGVDVYRGYAAKTKLVRSRQLQAYLFWFLRRGCRCPIGGGTARSVETDETAVFERRVPISRESAISALTAPVVVTSEIPSDRTKYVRGNLVWHCPHERRPVYLDWWTEYFYR